MGGSWLGSGRGREFQACLELGWRTSPGELDSEILLSRVRSQRETMAVSVPHDRRLCWSTSLWSVRVCEET